MIPRYEDPDIAALFADPAKLLRWQDTEFAVIRARVALGLIDESILTQIESALNAVVPDVAWWKARDKEIHHDLNAFIDERRQHLSADLHAEFHRDMTSYDAEEPAFARCLLAASALVARKLWVLRQLLILNATEYRHVVMLERTHGQGAKLRSLGGRFITWHAPLALVEEQFLAAAKLCERSRISGAIGNYGGGLTPDIEREALRLLELTPFYGATQIAPRELYAPLAQSLVLICQSIGKIALDVRLGARSGLPLFHEPFAQRQKGSSAMPHKKNPINTEQMTGMAKLAMGYGQAIVDSIQTWEARAIEQSCIERTAWPDLFHVTMRMLTVMQKVLDGLVIYPDHMLREIVESRGTYASDEAKNFLAAECAVRGIDSETAYRIVQLAAFCVFKPDPNSFWGKVRTSVFTAGLAYVDHLLVESVRNSQPFPVSICDFLLEARLFPVPELDGDESTVAGWNVLLSDIFSDSEKRDAWKELFHPSYLLRSEAHLFAQLPA